MSNQSQIKWLLNAATSVFNELSDSAALDAELLMCFVIKRERTYLFTWPEKELSTAQVNQFQQLVQRRTSGEPVAHITGEKEFWSLNLAVNPSTLIPRPDTETLVEVALNIAQSKPSGAGLDLGTGTGAIALALASELINWQWTGAEMNLEALELAKQNGLTNNISNASFVHSNWFSDISERKFDLIVSNPPYIDPDDQHLSQGDVRFEPLSALIASDNGLADIKTIVNDAKTFLAENAALIIEHGFDQRQAVQTIFVQNGYTKVETFKDLAGNDRVTVGYFK